MENPAIFVSYSWKSESKDVVDEIQVALKAENIEIQRDVNILNYKGSITGFMKLIGRGKIIILVIGKDYLESENCMYELMQIASQGDIYERIVPIYLPSADIHKISLRVKYIQFWTDKNKEIENLPSNILMNMPQDDIRLYRDISQKIGDLIQFLANINALSVEMHQKKNWKDLIDMVKGMMGKLRTTESSDNDALKQELIVVLRKKQHLGIADILEKIDKTLTYEQYDHTQWVSINSKISPLTLALLANELVQATQVLINSIR